MNGAKKDERYIHYYFYDFIISVLVVNHNLNLEKDLKLEAICFMLKNLKEIDNNINNEDLKKWTKIINLLNEEKNFINDDFKYILKSINDNIFDEVNLFLYNKIDKFNEYIKIYLSKDMEIGLKSSNLYNWINDKLETFNQNDSEKYERLVETLKDNILELASLSMSKFYELSNKFSIIKIKWYFQN